MAVYVYGITNQDVYDILPFGTSSITATSKITPDMITRFIEEGSAFFTGALKNAGVSNESLSDAQNAQISQGVIDYCVSRSLQVLGGTGQPHQGKYEKALAQIRSNEAVIGSTGSTVESNIDTTKTITTWYNRPTEW